MSPDQIARLAGPSRPLGSPDIPQYFLPATAGDVYAPRLYGAARIHFADRRRKIDETRRVAFLVPLEPTTKTIDWDTARETSVMPESLLGDAPKPGRYLPLPAGAMDLAVLTRWARGFDRWLARTQRLAWSEPSSDRNESAETLAIPPKRGGVSVELVAIAWEIG